MKYIKSPFNWAGNKYKFLSEIILKNSYKYVIDLFMGTGNIAFNINAKKVICNDIIPLLPKIYSFLQNNIVDSNLFEKAIEENYGFEEKQNYYDFRTHWNRCWKVFLTGIEIDASFVIDTLLLTKMCSNSMVRFNKKFEFNQGFRGTEGKFFSEKKLTSIKKEFVEFNKFLYKNNKFIFLSNDFEKLQIIKDALIIADPPYVIKQGIYDNNYTLKNEKKLLQILNSHPFVYFNYLSYTDPNGNYEKHELLDEFLLNKDIIVKKLRKNTTTGQNRVGTTSVEEVLLIREQK